MNSPLLEPDELAAMRSCPALAAASAECLLPRRSPRKARKTHPVQSLKEASP